MSNKIFRNSKPSFYEYRRKKPKCIDSTNKINLITVSFDANELPQSAFHSS